MTIPKLLAQLLPAAATLTSFYAVLAGARTYAHRLFICNAAAAATTFRVSVAPAAEPDAAKHYLFYDAALAANETKNLELDLRLSSTDLIRIYTPGANVSFNLFGTEEI
jgi:hypothetical protein